ncbi:MAG: hypothetical protein Q8R43_03415 [Alphaproteobacteria bacterium]|nr:hypothetical protein [Alphaproteobacteria bacterium]
MYDETPGPMQYLGEKLHQGAQKGFEFAGASRHSAEILATAAMDGVNIVTAATGAKAALRPVATSAGAALKTTLQHGVGVAKRVEFRFDPLKMGTAGGNVSVGLKPKAPAAATSLETAAGKTTVVSEAGVSSRPLGLTTAAERVRENPMLMKQYVQHMEKITEMNLHPAQVAKLKEALRTTEFKELTTKASDAHRYIFDKIKANLRQEWEINRGQKWPVYEKDYYNKAGTRINREAGQPYDAHHIIQSNHAGPNEW